MTEPPPQGTAPEVPKQHQEGRAEGGAGGGSEFLRPIGLHRFVLRGDRRTHIIEGPRPPITISRQRVRTHVRCRIRHRVRR